ncbi:MAG TPA: hypothetical protein VGX23_09295 [Actinocrinis sp.]|nr:hypothetical protein [Actinocrinis sp.]
MAVEIEGVVPDAVPGFLAGLAQASETLAGIPARLEAARVHDAAFGKLIDAAKVREAYHQRLPATEVNITEARELIDHFLAQFGGKPLAAAAAATVPGQGPEPEGTQTADPVPAEAPSAEAKADGDAAQVKPVQAIPAQPDPPQDESAPAEFDALAEPDAPAELDAWAEPDEPAVPQTPDEPREQTATERALAELIPGQGEPPAVESIPDELFDYYAPAPAAPEPVIESEPPVAPEPVVEPELLAAPAQVVEPEPELVAGPAQVIEPAQIVEPEPVIESEPVVEQSPAPAPASPEQAAAPSARRAHWWTGKPSKKPGRDHR